MSDQDWVEARQGQRDWGGQASAGSIASPLGGYGSAGLLSRRRQMERTTGGSYLHESGLTSGPAQAGNRQAFSGSAPASKSSVWESTLTPPKPTGKATWLKGNATGVAPSWQKSNMYEGVRPPELTFGNLSRAVKAAGQSLQNGARKYENHLAEVAAGSGTVAGLAQAKIARRPQQLTLFDADSVEDTSSSPQGRLFADDFTPLEQVGPAPQKLGTLKQGIQDSSYVKEYAPDYADRAQEALGGEAPRTIGWEEAGPIFEPAAFRQKLRANRRL